MAKKNKAVFACGENFFCSLFKQTGCVTADITLGVGGILKKMKESNAVFFIFSQTAFEKLSSDFKIHFEKSPYIVFPLPGEENKIEKEIAELVKLAVGVEI